MPELLYLWETPSDEEGKAIKAHTKYFTLIIYDISDNRRRNRLVKILKGFGLRVQLSAFEAVLSPTKYKRLLEKIAPLPEEGESVRVYKFGGPDNVAVFGEQFFAGETAKANDDEESIII